MFKQGKLNWNPFRKREKPVSTKIPDLKERLILEYEEFIYICAAKLSYTESEGRALISNAWHLLMQKADDLEAIIDDPVRMRSYISSVMLHEWQHFQRDIAIQNKYDELYRRMNAHKVIAPAAEEDAAHRLQKQQILMAVQKLPAKYRDVILMRYYEGCSSEEIASHLGIASTSVNQYAKRAREKLKAILIEDGIVEKGYDYE